jgi:hypothetical protein
VEFSSNILTHDAKNAERFLAPVKLHPSLGEGHMESSLPEQASLKSSSRGVRTNF